MVLGVLGALVGCSKPPPPPEEPVVVVASVYALGDIVRQVGGDHVKVEWLIESGDPLGPLEDTPERRRHQVPQRAPGLRALHTAPQSGRKTTSRPSAAEV